MEKDKKRRGKRGGKKHKDALPTPESLLNLKSSSKKETQKDVETKLNQTELNESFKKPFFNIDLKSYFLEMESKLDDKSNFEDDEDKSIFFSNFLSELSGNYETLAFDFDGSRILEKLINFDIINIEQFLKVSLMFQNVTSSISDWLTDKFASHVMQTFLERCFSFLDQDQDSLLATILEITKTIEQNVMSLIKNQYASHVIRTLFSLLSPSLSIKADNFSKKSNSFREKNESLKVNIDYSKYNEIPSLKESFVDLASSFKDALKNKRDLRKLAVDQFASPVLVFLVTINRDLVDMLFEESSSERKTPYSIILMKDKIGSHLVEQIITASSPTQLHSLFQSEFKSNLLDLALDQFANFILQKLIVKLDPADFLELVVELTSIDDGLKKLMNSNRGGVVEKIVKKGGEGGVGCEEIFGALCQSFSFGEEVGLDSFVGCCICFRTVEEFKHMDILKANTLHGSLIIQHILTYFPKTTVKKLERCFESLTKEEVLSYIRHKSLSRVIEAFLVSKNVRQDIKAVIIDLFKGEFKNLAKDRFGSFFLERAWKLEIGQELWADKKELEKDRYGIIVLRNLRVEQVVVGENSKREKKRKMFEDIIKDEVEPEVELTKKKKKAKK